MKRWSTLLLTLFLNLPVAAETTLFYGVTGEPKSQLSITNLTEELMQALLRDSGFTLRPRIVTTGFRTLTQLSPGYRVHGFE